MRLIWANIGCFLPIIVGNGPRHVGAIKQRRPVKPGRAAAASRQYAAACPAAIVANGRGTISFSRYARKLRYMLGDHLNGGRGRSPNPTQSMANVVKHDPRRSCSGHISLRVEIELRAGNISTNLPCPCQVMPNSHRISLIPPFNFIHSHLRYRSRRMPRRTWRHAAHCKMPSTVAGNVYEGTLR